jgi:tyrosine-specific transport protein
MRPGKDGMSERPVFSTVLAVCFLVVGNLIGAGILALPINTGLSGLLPSLLGMLLLGGVMYFTAVVLAGEAAASRKPTFNYPTLYRNHLGVAGQWVAVAANMLILYGLLVAYLTGGATIIRNLLHLPGTWDWVLVLGLFTVLTTITIADTSLVLKYNAAIMILLFVAFAAIVLVAEAHVDISHYRFTGWRFLPMAAPIIVTAFHFHNIIPSICEKLDWNPSLIRKTMLAGMVLGYVMNALWIQVGIGVLPLDTGPDSLLSAFEKNLPATVPMSATLHSTFFSVGALIFALIAIATSYIANGLGLTAFMQDVTANHFHIESRRLNVVLAFGPPLLVSLIYPQLFLKAINVVGGVGIVVLFGVLPSVIYIKGSRSRGARCLGLAIFILFLFCFLLEIGQEAGMLSLRPDVEHWEPHLEHMKR